MSAESPLSWTEDGQPRSRLFGDVYFSAEDGLAETRAVFLQGCGLPDAWTGRRRFVVGELGFGTGLNIAALLQLWQSTRPTHGHLHIFSIEAFPIAADEAARALGRWPELADVAGLLAARWPGRARGRHRVDLPELAATLDLAVMDATEALAGWQGRADAWFLDGFSPALNPQMWSDEVLGLVAARSAPGARAATFTVAGHVRRGLAAAGFAVDKRPGFGRKRERLEARLPGAPVDPSTPRVAIIGAGIAGASAARAVRALGGEAVIVETLAPGAGGSGNPAGLVTPRLDAGLGEASRLFAQAFDRAVRLYAGVPDAVLATGVLQLAAGARDEDRFARIAWTTDGATIPAAAWGGYALPTGYGVLFGATHDRDETSTDVRDSDHRRNHETLAAALPGLAAGIAESPLEGRAAIRAVTPDRLPVAGRVAERLIVLAGFGSRGLSLAPLLAEHVAALALGAPSPISAGAAELVSPQRFARRAARRGHY